MRGLITKIVRDLQKRPVRTALTTLGIAIGVAGLVAIVSTAWNITRLQRALFASTSRADLTYWVWEAPPSLALLLGSDARVDQAELRVSYITRWRPAAAQEVRAGLWRDIELVGIDDFAQVRVNRFDLVDGRYPQMGEVLLDLSASRVAGITTGDALIFRDEDGRERTLRISGVSRSPSYLVSTITNIAVGYVPATSLRRVMGISGSNQLLVRLHNPFDAQAIARRIDGLLRRQGIQHGAPELHSLEGYPGKRELDAMLVIMFLFSLLGLALSAFLVANTLSATVAEQIDEIAVLKTIGATSDQILRLFAAAALLHGAAGTVLGLGLGAFIGWRLLVWIGSLANATVSFRLAPAGVVLGIAVGLGVSLLGGMIPAWQGARTRIKEALESYGIQADYGVHRLDRLLQRISTAPPRPASGRRAPWGLMAMSLRNLSRRRGRTALTLAVIVLATAAFLGALATRESVNAAIGEIYTIYAADAWVWFGESLSVQTEDVLTTVEGVRAAEGWAIADGIVALARARLWGVPADTTLYRPTMQEGRWFRADEPDAVVLSSELAFAQGLRAGDVVEVQANEQLRRLRVVGIAIDNTIFLGGTLSGKAFVPRETLSSMLGSSYRAGFYALGLTSRGQGAADAILARLETRFASLRPHVQPIYAEIESAEGASRLLSIALAAMLLLVALVGGLGILNTLTLNVLERRREIAVLRIIGATDAAVIASFLSEGLALGLVGWVLGVIVGYPLGRVLVQRMAAVLFRLDFILSPWTVALSVVFTLGLALLSSLGPALGAAQASTSTSLRYE